MQTLEEIRATGATRVVVPVNGKYALYGIAFYLDEDDGVRCEKCGRVLQWPDAAWEHVRLHDALVKLSLWEQVKWWWKKRSRS